MHTILVVDDEEVVRTVVRDMLESDGYSILDTGDPQDALRIACEQPIHLLLSDVVMPVMKGPELATKVLAASPSTKVLLMSAYPMSEVAVSGERVPQQAVQHPGPERQGPPGAGGAFSARPPGTTGLATRHCRSLKRWILPVAVFGSSDTNSIQRGYL